VKRYWLSTILTTAMFCGSLQEGSARQLHDRGKSTNTVPSGNAFLLNAIEANAVEIELGMMAQSKSQNPRVQKFAAMLVRDHTNALDRLNRLASVGVNPLSNTDANVSPADTANSAAARCEDGKHQGQKFFSKEHQQICRRLAKLSGPAFDREYINAMVQEHRKTAQDFEQQAWSDSDSSTNSISSSDSVQEKSQHQSDTDADRRSERDARAIARELLPTLRMHLKQAESLQRQFAVVQ
jgi:predicted outer membrane protein